MKSLASKYRPKTLDEVVYQTTTVKILKKAVEKDSPKNVYLFAGKSGAGKTTLAKCFAYELNKTDAGTIEMDSASNNGVDSMRALVDAAVQRSLSSKYKIIILDEVHVLSNQAWQVLLKTFEDCPQYTIFILCTTEPNKVPKTIQNRAQRFNITEIPAQLVAQRLEYICQQEGFTNYTDACELISKMCGGGLRDAITLLDQCADYSTDLCLQNSKAVLGEAPYERMMKLVNFIVQKRADYVLAAIETLASEGKDIRAFVDEFLGFVLDLIKYAIFKSIAITNIPGYLESAADPMISAQATVANCQNTDVLNALSDKLLEIKNVIKYDTSVKYTVEAYLLQLCR